VTWTALAMRLKSTAAMLIQQPVVSVLPVYHQLQDQKWKLQYRNYNTDGDQEGYCKNAS
jgi:hypothetical protein